MLKKTHIIASFTPAYVLTGNLEYGLLASIFGTISDLDTMIGLKHRTVTHSLAFAILAGILAGYIKPAYGIIAFYGIMNHIILDMLTKTGVQLYWPLKSKRVRIYQFSYDSVIPNFLIIMLCLTALYIKAGKEVEKIALNPSIKELLNFFNLNFNLLLFS
ncbi:metal-dependent hydrolase [Archaeoglobus sp.]|jgi:inner membrane protein|uniref:metal-dependent hydrolase n=1 Tax=Archaeoglobus sp. TaxID=1872626 RepID=UPI0024AA7202|nr:metal-dependent hydrolase [Archaeoglobus sp.]MDI3498485.1 inner membrane protein [Archaeoglobus sp.]